MLYFLLLLSTFFSWAPTAVEVGCKLAGLLYMNTMTNYTAMKKSRQFDLWLNPLERTFAPTISEEEERFLYANCVLYYVLSNCSASQYESLKEIIGNKKDDEKLMQKRIPTLNLHTLPECQASKIIQIIYLIKSLNPHPEQLLKIFQNIAEKQKTYGYGTILNTLTINQLKAFLLIALRNYSSVTRFI